MAHRDAVWAVAFAPDGRSAVTGSIDGAVLVLDLERGVVERELAGHARAVRCALLSREARLAFTGSRDHAIAVWDLASGLPLATLRGHTGGVTGLAELPDGKLVSSSFDGTLRVWDPRRERELAVLRGHTSAVQSLAPAGRDRIVSGSRDRTVRVWDLQRGRELAVLRGHTHWVSRVATSADGRRALSAGEDGAVLVWDLERGAMTRALSIGPQPIWGAAISPDGCTGAAGKPGGGVVVWDLDTGRERATLARGWRMAARALAFSPDGARLLLCCDDSSVELWDLRAQRALCVFPGESLRINVFDLAPDEHRAVIGYADGALRTRDLEPECAGPELPAHGAFVFALRVDPTRRRAVSVALDGALRVSDLDTGRAIHKLEHGDAIFSLELFDQGRRALIAGGASFRIFDLETGASLAHHAVKPEAVHSFAARVGSTGNVAFACEEPELGLWNPEGVQSQAPIALESDLTSALAVTPDGRKAVVGTAYGDLWVVDLPAGKTLRRLPAHEDWVRDLRIAPDGRTVASMSQDRTFALHDLETGDEIQSALSRERIAAFTLAPRGGIAALDVRGSLLRHREETA